MPGSRLASCSTCGIVDFAWVMYSTGRFADGVPLLVCAECSREWVGCLFCGARFNPSDAEQIRSNGSTCLNCGRRVDRLYNEEREMPGRPCVYCPSDVYVHLNGHVEVDGGVAHEYCARAAEAGFTQTCAVCGVVHIVSRMHTTTDPSGDEIAWVCQRCSRGWTECVSCGARFDPPTAQFILDHNNHICPACNHRVDRVFADSPFYGDSHDDDGFDDFYEPSLDDFGVYDSSHEPTWRFYSKDGEHTQPPRTRRMGNAMCSEPFLGFELETDVRVNFEKFEAIEGAMRVLMSYDDGENLFFAKEDCSISGIEIVTHPMTAEWADENFPWKMLPELHSAGLMAWNGRSCGLHVHVSRAAFNVMHLHRFAYFILAHPDEMVEIAGRESTRYAKFPNVDSIDLVDLTHHGEGQSDRFWAVNFQPRHTVELRLFRGSLRPEAVRGVLQFVDAVYHYTAEVALSCLEEERDISLFEVFVKDHGARWPMASKLIDVRMHGESW